MCSVMTDSLSEWCMRERIYSFANGKGCLIMKLLPGIYFLLKFLKRKGLSLYSKLTTLKSHCWMHCYNSFLKYYELRELQVFFFWCSSFSLHPCSSHDLHLLARVVPLQQSLQHLVPWLLQLEATGKTRMPSPLISRKGVDLKYIANALEIRNREMQSRTRFMGKNYEMRKSNSLALT